MDGRHDMRGQRGFDEFPALLADAEVTSEQRLGGAGAQTNEHLRLHDSQLRFKPGAAGSNFPGVGLFVNAAFAFGFPFEVFHNIGDVDFTTVDPRFDESLIEKFAGGADEGPPLQIFIVARLLAPRRERSTSGASMMLYALISSVCR